MEIIGDIFLAVLILLVSLVVLGLAVFALVHLYRLTRNEWWWY